MTATLVIAVLAVVAAGALAYHFGFIHAASAVAINKTASDNSAAPAAPVADAPVQAQPAPAAQPTSGTVGKPSAS